MSQKTGIVVPQFLGVKACQILTTSVCQKMTTQDILFWSLSSLQARVAPPFSLTHTRRFSLHLRPSSSGFGIVLMTSSESYLK